MIGVALAEWLLDQHPAEPLHDAPGPEAEQFEQPLRRGGLTEEIDSEDGRRALR